MKKDVFVQKVLCDICKKDMTDEFKGAGRITCVRLGFSEKEHTKTYADVCKDCGDSIQDTIADLSRDDA